MPAARFPLLCALCLALVSPPSGRAVAAEATPTPSKAEAKKEEAAKAPEGTPQKPPQKKDDLKEFDEVTKDAEKIEGLFNLYRKKEKLYLELQPEQLDRDFLMALTLESGIGVRSILNGMPLQTYLCRFRRVNDQILFVERNVRFRANPGQPVTRSLERAFTDSVLASVKLESVHPERKSLLIDVAPLFMADLPGLGVFLRQALGTGYGPDPTKSYYGRTKSFPQNTELETYYSFNSPEPRGIDTLPDGRNLTLRVRYSLSELPQDHYRPRLADDRVGYFLTVFQDWSSDEAPVPFVRYINRWNLEKKDPDAPLSELKKPIVFWLENTIPLEYRDAIRAGILRWNMAFEKAGFKDAIQVKQQPDDADWDPADVRYNTIRWIHSLEPSFGAMGPSRVNPLTGEILDADILIDANMLRSIKQGYRLSVAPIAEGNANLPPSLRSLPPSAEIQAVATMALPSLGKEAVIPGLDPSQALCPYGLLAAPEAQFAATALSLRDGIAPNGEIPKEYIDQFLSDVTAHEVGHTLGLRHNFHASTMLPLRDLHNRALVAEKGLYGSVMDYNPPNLARSKTEQGFYFSPRVGPYDEWAIQYGYTPITASSPEGEAPSLRMIAERSTAPELAYATDEDTPDNLGPAGVDPLATLFDLSDDPIGFARQRVELAQTLMKRLEARGPGQGNSYADFRRDFTSLLNTYNRSGSQLTRWIGGEYFHRNHAGDRNARLPLEPVPAVKQREALETICRSVLAENALQFSPETLNRLAPSRWLHWGQGAAASSIDYPILEVVETIQWNALSPLYDPTRLRRLRNLELKVTSPSEALTLPDLFSRLTNTLWSEVLSDPARSITASRRAIQRDQLDQMAALVLQPAPGTPDDARALARAELRRLQPAIRRALAGTIADGGKMAKAGQQPAKVTALDAYTRAHLEDADARISKALAAPLIATQ